MPFRLKTILPSELTALLAVRMAASTAGNGIYAGAVIQIYAADANNAIAYPDENDPENGQDDLGRSY